MRLIEIQNGISVNPEYIESIVKQDDGTCVVYMGGKTYQSTYSYDALLELMNAKEVVTGVISKDEQIADTMKKLDGVLGEIGTFAG